MVNAQLDREDKANQFKQLLLVIRPELKKAFDQVEEGKPVNKEKAEELRELAHEGRAHINRFMKIQERFQKGQERKKMEVGKNIMRKIEEAAERKEEERATKPQFP